MPTGYTHKVADGEVTEFKAFALECARAFGACVTMRDSPPDAEIPDAFEPSDWHTKELAKARAEIVRLEAMTAAEVEAARDAEYDAAMAAAQKDRDKTAQTKARYEAMLAKVEAWHPPTAQHEGLREFMRDQLTRSNDFDCTHDSPLPEKKSPREWHEAAIARAHRSVVYHAAEDAKERERAASRTAWIRALKASL